MVDNESGIKRNLGGKKFIRGDMSRGSVVDEYFIKIYVEIHRGKKV